MALGCFTRSWEQQRESTVMLLPPVSTGRPSLPPCPLWAPLQSFSMPDPHLLGRHLAAGFSEPPFWRFTAMAEAFSVVSALLSRAKIAAWPQTTLQPLGEQSPQGASADAARCGTRAWQPLGLEASLRGC